MTLAQTLTTCSRAALSFLTQNLHFHRLGANPNFTSNKITEMRKPRLQLSRLWVASKHATRLGRHYPTPFQKFQKREISAFPPETHTNSIRLICLLEGLIHVFILCKESDCLLSCIFMSFCKVSDQTHSTSTAGQVLRGTIFVCEMFGGETMQTESFYLQPPQRKYVENRSPAQIYIQFYQPDAVFHTIQAGKKKHTNQHLTPHTGTRMSLQNADVWYE